ncbi:hypothetical protein FD755_006238 [Muntiacus reevesi]|uniref:Cytochrome c oxidase subunit 7C, mitochondrial n=1 Tax=Muntiacus reevesi TaxID=9886 RepID=A0A5J5MUW6_MUNRE|nr:hypothetical protein FD755_006238 [Muntiacus reevesi]
MKIKVTENWVEGNKVVRKQHTVSMMTLFFGSGFAAPFFIVRHQLLKK